VADTTEFPGHPVTCLDHKKGTSVIGRTTEADATPSTDRSRDRGMSFIEVLVAVVLIGLAVVGMLTAVRATVIGTRVERDHSKAQQWLQSAVGVIEAQDFASCDPMVINGAAVEAAYQAAIDHPTTGAKRPYGFAGATIDVKTPQVWNGTQFVDFDTQTVCYDQSRLRQQRVVIEVRHPNGIFEGLEMIKVDR
jgi:prepilin-type N-terminal cleavage/methylation domain-containing protein